MMRINNIKRNTYVGIEGGKLALTSHTPPLLAYVHQLALRIYGEHFLSSSNFIESNYEVGDSENVRSFFSMAVAGGKLISARLLARV